VAFVETHFVLFLLQGSINYPEEERIFGYSEQIGKAVQALEAAKELTTVVISGPEGFGLEFPVSLSCSLISQTIQKQERQQWHCTLHRRQSTHLLET
jgi:hypothetical protein